MQLCQQGFRKCPRPNFMKRFVELFSTTKHRPQLIRPSVSHTPFSYGQILSAVIWIQVRHTTGYKTINAELLNCILADPEVLQKGFVASVQKDPLYGMHWCYVVAALPRSKIIGYNADGIHIFDLDRSHQCWYVSLGLELQSIFIDYLGARSLLRRQIGQQFF